MDQKWVQNRCFSNLSFLLKKSQVVELFSVHTQFLISKIRLTNLIVQLKF